jgi:hypothetical protein
MAGLCVTETQTGVQPVPRDFKTIDCSPQALKYPKSRLGLDWGAGHRAVVGVRLGWVLGLRLKLVLGRLFFVLGLWLGCELMPGRTRRRRARLQRRSSPKQDRWCRRRGHHMP